ncbi:MAG TPA: preprotein translocase subunit SecE [Terracidiphilus sp.]|nr:preprotein translocase subunit SecE [Terracidiphilus sp.]
MATKTAIERGDERSAKRQEPGALQEFGGNAMGVWTKLTSFLSDVRAEMRKVVAPGWIEVRSTTFVVVVTVILFGAFFFVVDFVCRHSIDYVLNQLGGMQ